MDRQSVDETVSGGQWPGSVIMPGDDAAIGRVIATGPVIAAEVVLPRGDIAADVVAHEPVIDREPVELSHSARAIAAALTRCVARWGINKTTIEDVAREAGVSRATVYRQFPGGKSAILGAAAQMVVSELLSKVTARIAATGHLEDALVGGIHEAAVSVTDHSALRFMRQHEKSEFEKLIAFERMDAILTAGGAAMGPLLGRFMSDEQAFDVSVWAVRLLVSYLLEPAGYLDLTSEADVRTLVHGFMLPGLTRMQEDAERARTDRVRVNGSTTHRAGQDLTQASQDLTQTSQDLSTKDLS